MSQKRTPDQELNRNRPPPSPSHRQPETNATARASPTGLDRRNGFPAPIRSRSPSTMSPVSASSRASRTARWPSSLAKPEDKPSQAVIDKMKEAGFRWNPSTRYGHARSA